MTSIKSRVFIHALVAAKCTNMNENKLLMIFIYEIDGLKHIQMLITIWTTLITSLTRQNSGQLKDLDDI